MTIIFTTVAGERVETSDVQEVKRRAANGEITPDTMIKVDGRFYIAGKINGLLFGVPQQIEPKRAASGFYKQYDAILNRIGRICAEIIALVTQGGTQACEGFKEANAEWGSRMEERLGLEKRAESAVAQFNNGGEAEEKKLSKEKINDEQTTDGSAKTTNLETSERQAPNASILSETRSKPISLEAAGYLDILRRYVFVFTGLGCFVGFLLVVKGLDTSSYRGGDSWVIVGVATMVFWPMWGHIHYAILGLVREFLKK